MRFFRIGRNPFWGDFGGILQNGFVIESEPTYLISRTGPFVPPVSFPIGAMVLSDSYRHVFTSSQLFACNIQPVRYMKIVDLRWETWDLNGPLPSRFTSGPEDVILKGNHSRDCLRLTEKSWSVVDIPRTCTSTSTLDDDGWKFTLDASDWNGSHLFRSNNQNFIFVSDVGRNFFQQNSEQWMDFSECAVY